MIRIFCVLCMIGMININNLVSLPEENIEPEDIIVTEEIGEIIVEDIIITEEIDEIIVEDVEKNNNVVVTEEKEICKITPSSPLKTENIINGVKYTSVFNAKETNKMIDDVIKASKDDKNLWDNGEMLFEIRVEMKNSMQNAFFYPYVYDRVYRYVNKGSSPIVRVWASDYYVNDVFQYTEYYIK